jgi:hypothetical protein
MFAYGAAAALVISFFALSVFWREPRLERRVDDPEMAPVPQGPARAAFVTARALGLALFALVLGAAAFGDPDTSDNLAPVFIYVVFWVGLILVCALIGDLWRAVNPFDTLAAVVERLRPHRQAAAPYSHGYWLAALGLFGFVWMELVYPDRARPRALAVAITVYTVAVLAGAARWGRAWLRQGEAFTVFFGLLGRMAPVHVDGDGRLRLRPPLAGLASLRPGRGIEAVVLIALGSTTFDGVTRTRLWLDLTADLDRWPLAGVATLGLVWSIGMVALAYVVAMRVTARMFQRQPGELAAAFVHSLVPIAFAYALAHYFSLFVFEGQGAIALISDPFGSGWNLFGTAGRTIDYGVLSTTAVAYVQAGGILGGHVAGVVVAHDRALALFKGDATRSQFPLLAAMVLFTVTGLALLLGT